MFSDDYLLEQLVLKGGNVLDVIHNISSRPSADLDFSIDGDFLDSEEAEKRIKQSIGKTFAAEGLIAFDVKFRSVPPNLTADRADFWGGYKVEFKLIERSVYKELEGDQEKLRRSALTIGKIKSGSTPSTKFGIDLSKHEYCGDKERIEIDGYNIFVYSPTMFVCEKLRAICQQMKPYTDFVGSHSSGRARDFLDIFTAKEHFGVEFGTDTFKALVRKVFEVKRVDLTLIALIDEQREFHRDSFRSVQDTVRPGMALKDYDFYFDYVLENCKSLKSLWNE